MSSLQDCKKARKVEKGKVTKLCNKLSQVIAEDEDLTSIPELVDQLKRSFTSFTACHEQVVCKDTDEDVDHDKYFEEVQANYVNALCKAKPFKHNVSSSDASQASQGQVSGKVQGQGHTDSDLLNLLSLPKVELEVFSGDPLKYHSFIKSFEVNVDKLCKDPDSKIARLLQYTTGDAHEAIRGVQIVGGSEGYRRALDTLRDLYGSKHQVTEDIVKSLRKPTPVKSAHDMRQMSHDLRNAYDILHDLYSLSDRGVSRNWAKGVSNPVETMY